MRVTNRERKIGIEKEKGGENKRERERERWKTGGMNLSPEQNPIHTSAGGKSKSKVTSHPQ